MTHFEREIDQHRREIRIASGQSRHLLPSMIASLDDDPASQQCSELVRLLCEASLEAAKIRLHETPGKPDSHLYNIFPGEHYRLLAGLAHLTRPSLIIEIGTFTGMSSRVLLDHSPEDCMIHTYDIVAWDRFDSHLTISGC